MTRVAGPQIGGGEQFAAADGRRRLGFWKFELTRAAAAAEHGRYPPWGLVMGNESPPKSGPATTVSWAAFLLALACLGWLALYIPADRPRFVRVFADFQMKLPAATELMLSIPDAAFPAIAGTLALVLALLQWFVRAKGGVALFHMLIVVLCCVAFTAYRESMVQPLIALMNGLSR